MRPNPRLSFLCAALLIPGVSFATISFVDLPDLEQGQWQSLSAHNADVVWIGSNQGHVALTVNQGKSWELSQPVGGNYPVSQVEAIDARQAYALISGKGDASRLLRTRNGGYSWARLHQGEGDEHLRCFAILENGEGWILGDTVNGEWNVARSSNGRNWLRSRSGFAAPAQPGEGAINKSGSCVRFANDTWLMGTAEADTARIMYKSRTALRFNVADTPVTAGAGAGISSVWPVGPQQFLIAGGDFTNTDAAAEMYIYNNGEFTELAAPPLIGAVAAVSHYSDKIIIANNSGIAWTGNEGQDWTQIYDAPVQTLSCTENEGCYALGEETLLFFN